MLEELKKAIKDDLEISKALKDCSDDFLIENSSLIYKALSNEEVFDGYKIIIWVENDRLLWDYSPTTVDAKKEVKIKEISNMYTYKLDNDQKSLYLIDLNQVEWKKRKSELAIECKKIIESLEKNKLTKGFWLHSNSNKGKTFASIALLNTLADKGITVAYVNIGTLVSKVNETMNTWETSYSNLINNIGRAKVIVIDDLGVQKTTTWFNDNILIPILESRCMSNKTTIFTSNSKIDDLKSKMEYRVEFKKDDMETNNKLISKVKQLVNKEIQIG